RPAPSDQLIAPPNVIHKHLWCRTPTAHMLEVGIHIVEVIRATMGHQQDADHPLPTHPSALSFFRALRACTRSATACTCSTGVSGKMPWTRLKIWPSPLSGHCKITY